MDEITKDALKRAKKARKTFVNTCPASRHLFIMADLLAKGKPYPMLQEEPEHCAVSMLAVLAALWELRTKDAKKLERGSDANNSN